VTLNQLHKHLSRLIEQGYGRRQVCIDKYTFAHNCENDGVTILPVNSMETRWVPLADDDGGIATNSKGEERGSMQIVLYGDRHTPLTKRNATVFRASGPGGFCANCSRHIEAHHGADRRCSGLEEGEAP
jgi:hypothetical protein